MCYKIKLLVLLIYDKNMINEFILQTFCVETVKCSCNIRFGHYLHCCKSQHYILLLLLGGTLCWYLKHDVVSITKKLFTKGPDSKFIKSWNHLTPLKTLCTLYFLLICANLPLNLQKKMYFRYMEYTSFV